MQRKIIRIDEEKCNGCGLCVQSCQEGALQLIDGKAKLISESYCDGLGACLPQCPTGAIIIEEREAASFDEAAVKKHQKIKEDYPEPLACGCPGTHAQTIAKKSSSPSQSPPGPILSELKQWPCQIKLVPVNAPYFENAHLLVAADCTAYAYGNIHQDYMKGKITLIGCPKLDQIDYTEKLTEILKNHEIKSITVLRMEVPCCGGIVAAVKNALTNSVKMLPWQVVTFSTDGRVLSE